MISLIIIYSIIIMITSCTNTFNITFILKILIEISIIKRENFNLLGREGEGGGVLNNS